MRLVNGMPTCAQSRASSPGGDASRSTESTTAGIRPVLRDTLPSLKNARQVLVGDDQLTVLNDRKDAQVVRLRSK